MNSYNMMPDLTFTDGFFLGVVAGVVGVAVFMVLLDKFISNIRA
jgi:hypothetical protein